MDSMVDGLKMTQAEAGLGLELEGYVLQASHLSVKSQKFYHPD